MKSINIAKRSPNNGILAIANRDGSISHRLLSFSHQPSAPCKLWRWALLIIFHWITLFSRSVVHKQKSGYSQRGARLSDNTSYCSVGL